MHNMDDKEINELFDIISKHYERYLQKFGVKPINLKDSKNNKGIIALNIFAKFHS